MSAATILGCRPEIAASIQHAINTKDTAGWSAESIAEHLQSQTMPVTTGQVRHILALT